jgi:hypothetical protein
MLQRSLILAFVLALGACASHQPAPPTCEGDLVPINAGFTQAGSRK